MDDFRDTFAEFVSSDPHAHAPEEVMAALDILGDEMDELEPEDQELMIQAKDKIKNCDICANSLKSFSIINALHTEPAILWPANWPVFLYVS